jgi:cytidylate kinase
MRPLSMDKFQHDLLTATHLYRCNTFIALSNQINMTKNSSFSDLDSNADELPCERANIAR